MDCPCVCSGLGRLRCNCRTHIEIGQTDAAFRGGKYIDWLVNAKLCECAPQVVFNNISFVEFLSVHQRKALLPYDVCLPGQTHPAYAPTLWGKGLTLALTGAVKVSHSSSSGT